MEREIKIEKIRNLISYLNKTTYSQDIKIVMIDNAECLNLNSSNALLKALEEPLKNTFFFIIHDSSFKVLETIKSRCIEFKILFNNEQKVKILDNLINFYNIGSYNKLKENLYFDTPGNIIRYLFLLKSNNSLDFEDNKLKVALFFLEELRKDKNKDNLFNFTFFLQLFYNNLLSIKKNSVNLILHNYSKILNLLNDMSKFNLDEKNVLISVENLIKNDAK